MFGSKWDLSVRADRVKLAGANDPLWKHVLTSEGDSDAWRIVEASSTEGRPFDLELQWSAANGAGSKALVTVAHSTRVCVYARTVRVRVKNLDTRPNAVGVTVADGYAETRNQFEFRAKGHPDVATRIAIPPFAQRAWVDTADTVNGYIIPIDGEGQRRGMTAIERQADAGIPIGGARELEVWVGDSPFRVVFALGV